MTRKPALWTLLALLSLAAAAFSSRYFTRAFPLLSIDIGMDRQAALARASARAREQHLGPTDFREAASFSLDEGLQTFVELEGGGKPAFAALVGDRLYAPYRWRVRHFQEREKNEATFTFAPDGTPAGFIERLREDAPGAALAPSAARAIAEATAANGWRADLAPYQAIEQSQERRPGGRVDHTFVYERADKHLGDGRYRLRLGVSGDRLTELAYVVKVPDAFTRRYEQMRSLNTAIGAGGSLAFLVIYGAGGIAFGLFALARQRWVIWRQPVVWGVAVALAQTAARVNEWPLAWMQYDTALSVRSFVAQQAAVAVLELAASALLFSLTFMAAEGLTRRAFPDHPQLWRVWSREAGRSRAVAGRTTAGFLLVPIFIAYEVALYFFATRSLGWWTPSEALFNPDVLAAYTPWFSAIARSLQAGFWEESLFRAIPIAGAALIGDRFGHRRVWIVVAFFIQAAIFGAGHAPYPTQPAYARPVELVLPSIGFGLLYLAFGLLPGIVLHFAFDAFWFAMPLFAMTAEGIRLQQIMVAAMILVPLWVVVLRQAMAPRGAGPATVPRNRDWRPPATAAVRHEAAASDAGIAPPHVRWIAVAGTVAAVLWVVVLQRLPLQHHALRATRADAIAAARSQLAPARLGPEWRFLAVAEQGGDLSHRFIWRTGGASVYGSLLGTYLHLPGWTVFVRSFEGDVAERAETWTVRLTADGRVERVTHELPESRPGAALDEGEARQRARRALTERFAIADGLLKEVSAVPSKLPHRTDWVITYSDTSRTLPQGDMRLSVRITGDQISDVQRFVYVPDEWARTERNANVVEAIVQGASVLVAVMLLVAGAIWAIVSWSRHQFALRPFLAVSAAFLIVAAVRFANGFPAVLAQLSTAQPLRLQLAVLVGGGLVGLAVQSAAIGLVAGAVPAWAQTARLDIQHAFRLAVPLGIVAAAVSATGVLMSRTGPIWPSYANATALAPFLAFATGPVTTFFTKTALLLLVAAGANRLTRNWTRRRALVGSLLVILGGVLGATGSLSNAGSIGSAAISGALLLAACMSVLRYELSAVPLAVAVMTSAAALHDGSLRAAPGALPGSLAAVAIVWLIAYWWARTLARPRPATAREQVVASATSR